MTDLSARRVRFNPRQMMRRLLAHEAAGGFLLMAAAALALAWANSSLAPAYFTLRDLPIGVQIGAFAMTESLLHWINDGLMAVFFLLVGLEIKREMLVGELSRSQQLALPAIAAVSGMVAPALIYTALT